MLAVVSGNLIWLYFIYRENALAQISKRLHEQWFHMQCYHLQRLYPVLHSEVTKSGSQAGTKFFL